MNEQIQKAVYKGIDNVEVQLGRNFVPNQEALDFLQEYAFDNVKALEDETKEDLRQVLQRGILDNKPVSEIGDDIAKTMKMTENRAQTIARTEMNRALNMGELDAWEQSGVEGKKVWQATIDDRTSEICRYLNGKEVNIKDNFEYKGQNFRGPPAHVNCRSTISFIPKGADD